MLQRRYQEDEHKIQQVKDLDEQILKDVVAHATVNIHLLEDQQRLSPAIIEVFKNQVAKYEINIRFLEPLEFESIAAGGQAWKKFLNDQAGPSTQKCFISFCFKYCKMYEHSLYDKFWELKRWGSPKVLIFV